MAISHSTDPRNMGILDNADSYTKLTGPCGDTMEIWIKVNKGHISDISFMTDGCHNAVACCSAVTELVMGQSLQQALRINQDDILTTLNGLPEEDKHCALLTSKTLKRAISGYLSNNQ